MLGTAMPEPRESRVEVRAESPSDVSAIRSVHDQAFGGPYESRLVEMLRRAGRMVLSLVAVAGDDVVGHVVFSPVTVEPPSPDLRWVALGPIGVLPAHQGLGIGSRLVREGLDQCRTMACDGVVLMGAPEYYSRFGFAQGSEWGMTSEFGDGPAFQVTELRQGALDEFEGAVLFSPEFRKTVAPNPGYAGLQPRRLPLT